MDATKYDTHIFRVIWDSTAEGYKYYGVCPPSPKITFDINDIYSNDVYEAMLIPIKAYRTYRRTHTVPLYPASEYEELYTYAQTHKKFALDVTQILSISSPLYEPSIGFMAKYNNYRYTYNFSSIGIVVMVKTKIDIGNATDIEITIPCYVVNNYDCDGTLIWKE